MNCVIDLSELTSIKSHLVALGMILFVICTLAATVLFCLVLIPYVLGRLLLFLGQLGYEYIMNRRY